MSLIILLFFSLLLNCQQSPVGYEGIKHRFGQDTTFSFYPSKETSYGRYIPCGGTQGLVLGKNEYYECRALLKFPIKDSAVENIVSLKLVLYPKDTSSFNFTVYPLAMDWDEGATTWRLATHEIPWFGHGGYYFDIPLGRSSITKDSTIISLDRTFLDTLLRNPFGLILIPDSLPQAKRFAIFHSRTEPKPPKLVITYKDNKDKTIIPSSNAYIVEFFFSLPEDYLTIGSGYHFTTFLLFNLNLIPKTATIAHSELTLYPKFDDSFLPFDTFEIALWRLIANFKEFKEKTPFITTPVRRHIVLKKDTLIKIFLKDLINFWHIKPDSNFGVFVSIYPQNAHPSYLLIRNDTLFQPKLNILYFLPPKRRL